MQDCVAALYMEMTGIDTCDRPYYNRILRWLINLVVIRIFILNVLNPDLQENKMRIWPRSVFGARICQELHSFVLHSELP